MGRGQPGAGGPTASTDFERQGEALCRHDQHRNLKIGRTSGNLSTRPVAWSTSSHASQREALVRSVQLWLVDCEHFLGSFDLPGPLAPACTRARAHPLEGGRGSHRNLNCSIVHAAPDVAERILGELTAQLITVRSDLIQFPVTYDFRSPDQRTALPAVGSYFLRLAEEGSSASCTLAARGQRPPCYAGLRRTSATS